jgi:hypothetical protein
MRHAARLAERAREGHEKLVRLGGLHQLIACHRAIQGIV